MNLIPMIAKELGVEVGEEFDLCNGMDSSIRMGCIYKFSNACLMCADEDDKDCFGVASDKTLRCILNGSLKIIKLPFKPKEGEWYYLFMFCGGDFCVASTEFSKYNVQDLTNAYCGNCFRTKEEANNHKAEIYEKLTGRKWEER